MQNLYKLKIKTVTELTGHPQILHSNTTIIDNEQKAELGLRSVDKQGNEYIYLQGVGSMVAGDWVVYNEDYGTTRLTANEVGPVAIAMAAINATTSYGWYQIFGVNTIARTDTISADKSLYIDGTAGRADDLGVSGDLIIGAYSMTADTSNVATVFISYPHVSDDLGSSSAVSYADAETPTGTINGSNAIFTLANSPSPATSLILIKNGAVQTAGGVDYTLSGLTITYVTAPADGSTHIAWYRY